MAKTWLVDHVFLGAPMIPNLAKEITKSSKLVLISPKLAFLLDDTEPYWDSMDLLARPTART